MKSSKPLLFAITGALVSLLLVVAFGETDNSDELMEPTAEIGRFAFESGQYLAPSHTVARPLPGLFKIDTATGRVWRYEGRIEDKEKIEGWVLIPDRFAEAQP